jgi:cytochrome oxidase Cu insertion factor (SCO1/SenC/PrrC family)
MKVMLQAGMALLVAVAMTASAALAQQRRAAEIVSKVKVGDMAPDFTLNDHNNQPVKLSDFRGKKSVVLAFYVLAFTGG